MNLSAQTAVLVVVCALSVSGCAAPASFIEQDALGGAIAGSKPAPLTLPELAKKRFTTTLKRAGSADGGDSFSAYLVSYEHAGLTLYALVAVPKMTPPEQGFPLVVANHGYVPQPPSYGITSAGVNSRPGDYYRSVPELFTARGFLVVMPDYRGHNSSEGYDFIDPQDDDSVGYYAEDVVALMAGLGDIAGADLNRVFMWSHSMGGPVALRVLLATSAVKAVSFWSTMALDEYEPALADLDMPVVIHHSVNDASTAHANSVRLADGLRAANVQANFHSYDGGEHFFKALDRNIAADRDAALFLSF